MEKLQKQIRFYFSLTNLAFDKFLLTKLLYEKQISAETLLKFNKLHKMLKNSCDPIEQVLNVCKEIPELIVNNDKIALATPVSEEIIQNYRKEADTRSIYFENIPDSAKHSTIHSIFSKIGQVLYISLPRFPESKILKGFGFVEFSERQSCEIAKNELNGRIPEE